MDIQGLRRLLPLMGVLGAVYVAMVLFSAVKMGRNGGAWGWRAPIFLVEENPDGSWSFNALNQRKILEQAGINLILGVGMTFVILIAGIDLSVGAVLAVCNVVFVVTVLRLSGEGGAGWTPAAAFTVGAGVCIMAGLLIGAVNGGITVYGNVPSFITTLGTLMVGEGAAYLLSDGRTHYLPCPQGWNVAIPLLVCMVGVVCAHILLARTVFGRHIYAVGANLEAARLCGVAVNRVRLLAFVLSGVCAALGGVVYWARLATGSYLAVKNGYELYAIAAVVIGGTSLMGGEGSILGTLLGAMIMAVLFNGLNTVGIEVTTQKIIIGAVIVAAALYDQNRRRASR
jgi:ribose transport system permease protein